MTTESIKDRIAKLLAKAEGTDNQFEADTFMARVNELLEEHQIELNEIRLRMKGGRDNDPMGHQDGETNLYASIKWARDLAGGLALFYGCRFVYWRRGNHFAYQIVGRESARTTFELMLPFVISQAKMYAKRCWAANPGQTLPVWEREVGQALWTRVSRLAAVNNQRRDEMSKNALVPVNDVKAYMDELFGDLKGGRKTKVSYGLQAQEAAGKVSLNVQTTHTKTKQIGN